MRLCWLQSPKSCRPSLVVLSPKSCRSVGVHPRGRVSSLRSRQVTRSAPITIVDLWCSGENRIFRSYTPGCLWQQIHAGKKVDAPSCCAPDHSQERKTNDCKRAHTSLGPQPLMKNFCTKGEMKAMNKRDRGSVRTTDNSMGVCCQSYALYTGKGIMMKRQDQVNGARFPDLMSSGALQPHLVMPTDPNNAGQHLDPATQAPERQAASEQLES